VPPPLKLLVLEPPLLSEVVVSRSRSAPQSAQSVPTSQTLIAAPRPPSSQAPSFAKLHVSVHSLAVTAVLEPSLLKPVVVSSLELVL
jgi:hypothetical protein